MYSTRKEKSVIPERFVKSLNNNIDKCMILMPKNVYIDKLDDIVAINKYNNPFH